MYSFYYLTIYRFSTHICIYVFDEFSEDFCAENPCQNDGVCDNNIDGTGYECVCYGPYRGKNCEESIYEDYEGMSIFSLSVKNFIATVKKFLPDFFLIIGIYLSADEEDAEYDVPTTTEVSQQQQCEDSKDCKELGIVDDGTCEFAPWAFERCPVTCGKCTKDVVVNEKTVTNDTNTETRAVQLRGDGEDETTREDCKDEPDCKSLGIIDEGSCEFAVWALERCPATCKQCTIRRH